MFYVPHSQKRRTLRINAMPPKLLFNKIDATRRHSNEIYIFIRFIYSKISARNTILLCSQPTARLYYTYIMSKACAIAEEIFISYTMNSLSLPVRDAVSMNHIIILSDSIQQLFKVLHQSENKSEIFSSCFIN